MVRGFFNDSFGMAEPAGPHIPNSKRARTRSADERNVPFNSGKIRRPGQSNFLRFNVIGLIHLFFGQKLLQQFSFCWVSL
jgi:hypothetical protein